MNLLFVTSFPGTKGRHTAISEIRYCHAVPKGGLGELPQEYKKGDTHYQMHKTKKGELIFQLSFNW